MTKDTYKKLSWEEQYAYREGVLDSYNIILDSIQDQLLNNGLSDDRDKYLACDKLAKELRSYLNAICLTPLNV